MLNFGAAPFGVIHRHLLSVRCRPGIVIGRFFGIARDDIKDLFCSQGIKGDGGKSWKIVFASCFAL